MISDAIAARKGLPSWPARLRPSRLLPLREKLPRALRIAYKHLRVTLAGPQRADKRYLFIFGCQRSGTTLVTHILERDANANVYGERSRLSSRDTRYALRLNPVSEVVAELERSKYALCAAKPLVESQNAARLLKQIPGLKAIWLFRRFADVASSDLKLFGRRNGIDNLRPIYRNDREDWRAQNVSEATRSVIASFFDEDMSPYDAAALFWYVRNAIYFEQRLDEEPAVLLVRYEDLVSDPVRQMQRIYRFAGVPFPGAHATRMVNTRSVGKGADIELSASVRLLCDELYERLMCRYRADAGPGDGLRSRTGTDTPVGEPAVSYSQQTTVNVMGQPSRRLV